MEDFLQLLQDWAFEPEVLQAVSLAFIMACRELNATETSAVIRNMIAKRIIGYAQRGEHDPDRLCRQTVDALLPKRHRAA